MLMKMGSTCYMPDFVKALFVAEVSAAAIDPVQDKVLCGDVHIHDFHECVGGGEVRHSTLDFVLWMALQQEAEQAAISRLPGDRGS
jgi:hypothetical protein